MKTWIEIQVVSGFADVIQTNGTPSAGGGQSVYE